MHNDEYKRQAQQLEQVIATVFTCRSVVKYNLSVDEEHKEKMLQDIDASIEVLRECVPVRTMVKPPVTDLPIPQVDGIEVMHANNEKNTYDEKKEELLQALYRMYYAFIDTSEQTNIQSFVTRFNEVLSLLDEVRWLFEQKAPLAQDMYAPPVLLSTSPRPIVMENLLEKVKVFICDIYYIFMDFIRTLSSLLQKNDVQLNTEKLSSLPGGRRIEKIRRVQLERLYAHTANRQGVQEAYQHLQQRRLQVESQISEVTAFLAFLKKILGAPETKMYQKSEILAQTETISLLLADLLQIVADYEKIAKIE